MHTTSKQITLLFALALVVGSDDVSAQETLQEEKPSAQLQDSESTEPQDEMADAENPTEMPVVKNSSKSRRRSPRSYSKRSDSFLSAFSPVVGSTSSAVVRIMDGNERIALGTVVDANEGLILTKASEMRGDLKCKFSDGTEFEPMVVGVDPETDLIMLKVEKNDSNEVVIEDVLTPDVGSWLATVSQESTPLAVGIISHEQRLIPSHLLNSAIIGIEPMDRIDGDGVRINGVSSDSPAEEADLLVNDVIIGIDDQDVKDREQLMEILSHYYPGDEIKLKILRDGKESDVLVTLGKRGISPMFDRGTQQNRMGSKLSKRRSKFPLALQHDTALDANDCGGPIVDLSGRVVGINIARDGRVSSLALPSEVVAPVIVRLKTGKMLPAVVNKKEIASVEKELAQLEVDLKNLPEEKMEQELEFSAGAAIEEEIQSQIAEIEKRLKDLQARLKKKKELNKQLGKSLAILKNKQSRLKRDIKPLKSRLNRLKTGIE